MKLSPGVNFINVLQAAFTHANPKSSKKTAKLSVFFALSGSGGAKLAHRTLMKLTPVSVTVPSISNIVHVFKSQ